MRRGRGRPMLLWILVAVGQPVGINMERAFELGFRDVLWLDVTISMDGRPILRSHGTPLQFHRAPVTLQVPRVYLQAGTYPVEIRLQCALGIERASRLRSLVAWLARAAGSTVGSGWLPARTYDCDFTVRTEVVVMAKDQAETAELMSSPDLDRAMRRAFLMDSPDANAASSTPAATKHRLAQRRRGAESRGRRTEDGGQRTGGGGRPQTVVGSRL